LVQGKPECWDRRFQYQDFHQLFDFFNSVSGAATMMNQAVSRRLTFLPYRRPVVAGIATTAASLSAGHHL
jgi:hypothetical protein